MSEYKFNFYQRSFEKDIGKSVFDGPESPFTTEYVRYLEKMWGSALRKNKDLRKTVRAKRPAQQRKGKTVRSCKSCVRLGNEYFCQPCDGEYSNWKPRTASPIA